MSTAVTSYDYNTAVSTKHTADDFNDLAQASEFLQRLQLYTKGKPIDKGLIRPGHYGIPISADEIEDLGDIIDVIPFTWKPKAIDMTDKEAIIVTHDKQSDAFQRIRKAAQGKESNCMYGPSFLIFERSTAKFYEFFCGNKSGRGEAAKISPFLPLTEEQIKEKNLDQKPHGALPMTLKVRLVEGKFSYHVPVASKCSVPFDNLPKGEVILAEINKFHAVSTDGVERVEEPVGAKRRAR